MHRFPTGVLPPNDQGYALLEAIIRHMVFFSEKGIRGFADRWANWVNEEELTEIVHRAKLNMRRILAAEAGKLVKLTTEERTKLKITTMRPADVSEEEFFERRKEFKRLRDRERQRAHRDKLKSKTARLEVQLPERERTVYRLLTRRWRRTRRLAEEARKAAAFKNISSESARVLVHRTLDYLEKTYLVESRLVDGPKNFRAREVRRKHTFPVTVK